MIKASMVTDCRLGMYTTVASGGSERGHNAMFLVYGAGAPPSRMGNFRENYGLMLLPGSCDTGASIHPPMPLSHLIFQVAHFSKLGGDILPLFSILYSLTFNESHKVLINRGLLFLFFFTLYRL